MGIGFQAAMGGFADQFLKFGAFGPGKQRDAGALNGSIADLDNFRVRNIGNEPNALRRFDVQMPPKAASQVKNVDIVEANAILIENDAQAGHVRALGLGEFVDVALGEIDLVTACREVEAIFTVLESAKLIDA